MKKTNEDPSYAKAEIAFEEGIKKYGVTRHADESAGPKALDPVSVAISGAPRQLSGKDKPAEGVNGDPRDRLDVVITLANDLRAATENEVRKAALADTKSIFEKVKLADGSTLASRYNLTGEAANDPALITPKVTMDTSFNSASRASDEVPVNSDIHMAIDLPKGVSHSDTIEAIATGKPITDKKAVEKLMQERALASNGASQTTSPQAASAR